MPCGGCCVWRFSARRRAVGLRAVRRCAFDASLRRVALVVLRNGSTCFFARLLCCVCRAVLRPLPGALRFWGLPASVLFEGAAPAHPRCPHNRLRGFRLLVCPFFSFRAGLSRFSAVFASLVRRSFLFGGFFGEFLGERCQHGLKTPPFPAFFALASWPGQGGWSQTWKNGQNP